MSKNDLASGNANEFAISRALSSSRRSLRSTYGRLACQERSLLREGGESSHDGDGLFCLTALIWRCLGVGAWVWHDGYVHVFRVVLFSESVVLSCGEAVLSVGAVRAGFRRARGLSDESECRPLITYLYPKAAVAAKIDKLVNRQIG